MMVIHKLCLKITHYYVTIQIYHYVHNYFIMYRVLFPTEFTRINVYFLKIKKIQIHVIILFPLSAYLKQPLVKQSAYTVM